MADVVDILGSIGHNWEVAADLEVDDDGWITIVYKSETEPAFLTFKVKSDVWDKLRGDKVSV